MTTRKPRHPRIFRGIELTLRSMRKNGKMELTTTEMYAEYAKTVSPWERQSAKRVVNIMNRWKRRLGIHRIGKKIVPRDGWNTGYTPVWRMER